MPEKFSKIAFYLQMSWQRHPFRLALCVSLLIHLIFLSVRWGFGEIENRRLNTPLSVVLVNAINKTPPKEANKLAQADLQGGGKTENQDATALHRARLGAEARLEILEKQQKKKQEVYKTKWLCILRNSNGNLTWLLSRYFLFV